MFMFYVTVLMCFEYDVWNHSSQYSFYYLFVAAVGADGKHIFYHKYLLEVSYENIILV